MASAQTGSAKKKESMQALRLPGVPAGLGADWTETSQAGLAAGSCQKKIGNGPSIVGPSMRMET